LKLNTLMNSPTRAKRMHIVFKRRTVKQLLLKQVVICTSLFFSGFAAAEVNQPPNILLIIADDLGVDALGSYGYSNNTAKTPNLDRLAADGVSFDNFWATPACTTTRGALISGLHGFESGIDYVPAVMPDNTATLQQRLKANDIVTPYATGVFGKWHLGGPRPDVNHPQTFGVDQYSGNLFNLDDYFEWTLTSNGKQTTHSQYHTQAVTDFALSFIQEHSQQPWFTWVAYSAPHSPFHEPPSSLISANTSTNNPVAQYRAMIEAMDSEIGRLLDNLPDEDKDNTLVVFMGDNGTPKRPRDKRLFAKDHVKGTLYEGGIRTPMIVAGAGVERSGERETALINVTDMFASFTEVASQTSQPNDVPKSSVSFVPLLSSSSAQTNSRAYNYSEWSTRKTPVSWTLRDADYKVIQHHDGRVELFAGNDVSETKPLSLPEVQSRLLSMGQQLRSGELD